LPTTELCVLSYNNGSSDFQRSKNPKETVRAKGMKRLKETEEQKGI
jgi:hypothetical protein